jgi:hypothetical protein
MNTTTLDHGAGMCSPPACLGVSAFIPEGFKPWSASHGKPPSRATAHPQPHKPSLAGKQRRWVVSGFESRGRSPTQLEGGSL